MRTLVRTIVTLSLFLFALTAHAEEIRDFTAEYHVRTDGSVEVTETIIYDFGSDERHGIFRTLGTEHPQPPTKWYNDRSIDIEVTEVKQNGVDARFEIAESGDEVEVKIGHPDELITGANIYTISYSMRGALSYGSSGAEFYYDVTGNDWPVAITQVTATVLVDDVSMLADNSACYVGSVGSEDRCAEVVSNGPSTSFSAGGLGPYQGLTIAKQLNPEAFAVLVNEKVIAWPVFVLFFLTYLLGGAVYVYRYRDAYDPEATIIAEYEPYPGVLPIYTGLLIDGSLDPKDITAGVVYLAEQGFLKIRRVEEKVLGIFRTDDYELTLLRPKSDSPSAFLEKVLSFMFTGDAVGEVVRLKQLKKDQAKQRTNSVALMNMRSSLATDMVEQGFYEGLSGRMYVNLTIGALMVALSAWFIFNTEAAWAMTVLTGVLLITFMVLGRRRRTKKGFAARNHLRGFKEFLSVTDSERFKFHNAPEKSPELFMAFLPYAIALGVEKQWAKVFKDISIPNPSWYDGGSTHAFSAAAFSSDLGSFSSSFSASSGTSGSSGGGSSGGGGGGGGGGSW